jgi:hypothetical protein
MSTFSEELTRLHLHRYSKLADDTAVSLAHSDILITENEVIQSVLQEAEKTGESVSLPFCKIEDLKNGRIQKRNILQFRMHAIVVLFHAAKHRPELITEDCLTDCEMKFTDFNAASQIRIIEIFEILGRRDKLEFLKWVRDNKDRPNAISVVEKDGQYFEKLYRDENLSDDVQDAAVRAIETISA